MCESVDALSQARQFQFSRTPWCDTGVSFATLGRWDLAMKLVNWRVNHDAFDGLSALCDLVRVARESGDLAKAADLLAQTKTLLLQAKTSATGGVALTQLSSLLASVVTEYVRMGQLDEAMKDDLLTSKLRREDVLDRIAAELSAAGRTEEAMKLITAPDGRLVGSLALPALVDAFLAAGNVEQAETTVRLIYDSQQVARLVIAGLQIEVPWRTGQRAEKLASIASALLASGKREHAHEVISEAVGLSGAGEFLKDIAEKLVQAGEEDVAVRLIADQWLAAPTRTRLLGLIVVVDPIIPRHPEVARDIQMSFGWVDEALGA